jgi:hypothetical protein
MSNRPIRLIALLAGAVLAACTDSTSPTNIVQGGTANLEETSFCDADDSYFECQQSRSLPPPPSVDSGASTTNVERGTHVWRVEYFFSPTYNTGWLRFDNTQSSGYTASKNARIDYIKGRLSGRGTLSYNGTVILDLSSIHPAIGGGICKERCTGIYFADGTSLRSSPPPIRREDVITHVP